MGNSLCMKVRKEYGEKARVLLSAQGLLDRQRKIKPEGMWILIPLLRPVDASISGKLGCLGDAEVIEAELPPAQSRSKTLESILRGSVPDGLAELLPKSYDAIGDIIVLESLDPQLAPYKSDVGRSLLEINPGAKTVLLKSGKVDGKFRVPSHELLAGEDKRATVHLEHGIRLKVDVSKAYFSPRLGSERHRVAGQVADGETVVDLFAGIGPFSLMIAKRSKARVYSIDLNPEAISLLKENISMNKLRGEVIPILGDAAEAAERLGRVADRVIMNLPGSSLDFLGSASKVLKAEGGMIHVYVFSRGDAIREASAQFMDASVNLFRRREIRIARLVKQVAPREWQVALDVWAMPV